MNKEIRLLCIVYCIFHLSSSLFGLGEKVITNGSSQGWEAVETWEGVVPLGQIRPHPVLALSSERNTLDGRISPLRGALDMALSFDESRAELFSDRMGNYSVSVSPSVTAISRRWARAGTGAAHFSGNAPMETQSAFLDSSPMVIIPRRASGLFSPNSHFGDFTIEFWIYPLNLENGEQIIYWTSARQNPLGNQVVERIQCVASRNRLQWNFLDFFSSPDDSRQLNLSFGGLSPITPQTWSHHLVRFDSQDGCLEYLVNGRVESILYATSSGKEGGEVYAPVSGEGSRLVLGGRFSGLLDEFHIYRACVEPALELYPRRGGRMETRLIDLGEENSQILAVNVAGGVNSDALPGRSGQAWGPLLPGGFFRFPDDSAIQFFIRAGDSPFIRVDGEWKTFKPGEPLDLRGRYVQLAAEFFPSGDGEVSPYLEELRIVYIPDEPPAPPTMVTAIARDGAVELFWRSSADRDVNGYLVYYGVSRGNFFGNEAILGVSPIDVGNRTQIRIDGLQNGVLYYFAIAAYDRHDHGGEFSREVSARPLRMIE